MKHILTFEPNKPDPTDVAHILKDAADDAIKECYRTDLLSVNHINVLLHVIEFAARRKTGTNSIHSGKSDSME
ncbi:hypothetical protein [Fictibacillus sp. NRS-1165]|uniref:hypothetical protein n=1 Tax=Fictibacillus sp. NRS-1165 TaxID=3144463 RepID=UPI003D197F51